MRTEKDGPLPIYTRRRLGLNLIAVAGALFVAPREVFAEDNINISQQIPEHVPGKPIEPITNLCWESDADPPSPTLSFSYRDRHDREIKNNSFEQVSNDVRAYLELNSSCLDYTQIIDPTFRIVMFGERHVNPNPKEEVITHLKTFRKMGLTHLGMEMLSTNMQPFLDAFFNDGSEAETIQQFLKATWHYTEESPDLYMKMIKEAASCGINIVGLDKSKDLIASVASYTERQQERDLWMHQTVRTLLDISPKFRVLTFTGADHADIGIDYSLATLLDDVPGTSIYLTGGQFDHYSTEGKVIRLAGAGSYRVFVPASLIYDNPPYDWILNSPQATSAR